MAVQPMSIGVQQPTPPGRDVRVAVACGKSQGQIPLFSQLLDGVRDLFVDFEYATNAVNKCSEPFGIGVPVSDLSLGLKSKGGPEISMFFTWFLTIAVADSLLISYCTFSATLVRTTYSELCYWMFGIKSWCAGHKFGNLFKI